MVREVLEKRAHIVQVDMCFLVDIDIAPEVNTLPQVIVLSILLICSQLLPTELQVGYSVEATLIILVILDNNLANKLRAEFIEEETFIEKTLDLL